MARILYGIHGTGHGHAMRGLTIARRLGAHEFLFVANDDAPKILEPEFRVHRIPNLGTVFRNYQVDVGATVRKAIPLLWHRQRYVDEVLRLIDQFKPDVCMTDLEYFVPRAAEKAGLPLFCGSYPITPATVILEELAKRKDLGVKTVQAEDEIAGICTAIGASFAGNFAVTTTSGPGLSLKSEALGLAVMTELPLVVVDVQRGGPSTGLPTKTEQSDLQQALYGRNGESPVAVIAASMPSDCFHYAFEAGRIAMEHMTPVVLLSDGFIANGSEPWKIPSMKDYPTINPPIIDKTEDGGPFMPYARNEKLARSWAFPGKAGLEHRVGGLEKDKLKGSISIDPQNHQEMTNLRAAKIAKIADYIPHQTVYGDPEGDLLVVGWGGTRGHLQNAVDKMRAEGKKVSLCHFNYINPLPHGVADIFKRFKKIVVCELNEGQFANYLRGKLQQFDYEQYNKCEGQPFTVTELTNKFHSLLK